MDPGRLVYLEVTHSVRPYSVGGVEVAYRVGVVAALEILGSRLDALLPLGPLWMEDALRAEDAALVLGYTAATVWLSSLCMGWRCWRYSRWPTPTYR